MEYKRCWIREEWWRKREGSLKMYQGIGKMWEEGYEKSECSEMRGSARLGERLC